MVEKSSSLVPAMDSDGVLYIAGDATDEENLIKAGIQRAKVLIAALATDTDNVFLVLTASIPGVIKVEAFFPKNSISIPCLPAF